MLLSVAAAALLWVLAHYRNIAVRVGAGALALVLAAGVGVALVNDYYGYYQSWTQLSADLGGGGNHFEAVSVQHSGPVVQPQSAATAHGRLEQLTFAGALSGISRGGYVYLPPQYFDPQYADMLFPVVELIHGSPGSPRNWIVQLQVVRTVDKLLREHQIGPMVLVFPTMNDGHRYEDCVDAPGAADDTYISQDVRADVLANFRVSAVPADWGITGYSSGGYCAANLALRHRALFGAAAVMDGYFRPQDGPAAVALHHDAAAEAANDPLAIAAQLSRTTAPLPSFWLAAGTAGAGDLPAAPHLAAALHDVEQVALYREQNAGHNFYAWSEALPHALGWLWTQLAPPELRTRFPVTGDISGAGSVAPAGSGASSSAAPASHHHKH